MKDLVHKVTFEIKQLKEENDFFRNKSDSQGIEIQDFEMSAKRSNDISENLNEKLSESTVKFKKEKSKIFKEDKVEVKFWRHDLETPYRTNVQDSIVINCVDLTHHFILKYTAYYYM